MSDRHWIAPTGHQGRLIHLYLTTTDELIEADLKQESARSLIARAKTLTRRQVVTNLSNHYDLAVGAFDFYTRGKNLTVINVDLIDQLPEGLTANWLGGTEAVPLFCVFRSGAPT